MCNSLRHAAPFLCMTAAANRRNRMNSQPWRSAASLMAICGIGALALLPGCTGNGAAPQQIVASMHYRQVNLVSDLAGVAPVTDANLVNPWGIAFNPSGFIWVANNHTGKATLYDGSGVRQSLVVDLPTPTSPTGGAATG